MTAQSTTPTTSLPPAMQDLHLLSGLMRSESSINEWMERAGDPGVLDPFHTYCSRTGVSLGTLDDNAIGLLIQIAESVQPGDVEAQLIHMQNTALRNMRPHPAWTYLTPDTLKLLGEQDPYGTGVYLTSRLFKRASLKTADSLDRNEWIIRLREKFESEASVTDMRRINSYLFGLDILCGLPQVRKPKSFDIENPIVSIESFLAYLKHEHTLASDPSPHDESRCYWQIKKDREEQEIAEKHDSLTKHLRGDFLTPVPTPKEARSALRPESIEKRKRESRNVAVDNAMAMAIMRGFGAVDFESAMAVRRESEHSMPETVAVPTTPTRPSFADMLAQSQSKTPSK